MAPHLLGFAGNGTNQGEDWIQGSDQMLEVVERFIDNVLPEGKYVLAGESYGGI